MAWEQFVEHKGEPLYLVPIEGTDELRRPVTRLQWIGKGDRLLVETRRTPDSSYFNSYTGVVLAVTYPGQKGHGLFPDRTLHLASTPTTKELVSIKEISRLVNLDMVLGQESA